jgi:pseudouridine kinase
VKIVVVGGMNLDLLGVPTTSLLPRDSAPGRITMRSGGVGHNIASRLRQLGANVQLITALGNDERARLLSQLCRDSGLDFSLSVQTDRPAPCYLCIHDEAGDMAMAVNDMSAMEELTPEVLSSRISAINEADGCVLDANLPQNTLLYIAQHAQVPLILDPVSCAKAPRIKGIIPYLTAIKPNRLEAAALTGEKNVEKAARSLLEAGVQNVFVSLGPEGIYYANPEASGYIPAHPLPSTPLTGAGDALCAGLTAALLEHRSIRDCAKYGIDTAYHALLRGNLS